MSLLGSRGLVRASKLSTCSRQAAIVADGVSEVEIYESYFGEEFPGEYGERPSARRRGTAFERAAYMNDAAGLRHSLGPYLGFDPEEIWVRNFEEEYPWPRHRVHPMRLSRTLRVFDDLANGVRVPEILIQPQLRLTVRADANYVLYIAPDALVLDPRRQVYVPVELKSFPERDGVADRADLDGTRRQAGVEVRALQETMARHGLQDRVDERAIFIFATPYGLQLAPPHDEDVRAACREIDRSLRVVAEAHVRLEQLRRREGDVRLENLLDEFATDYQDACHGSCVFADPCRTAAGATARVLGDRESEIVGGDFDLGHLLALADGAVEPRDDEEARLGAELRAASERVSEIERRAA